MTRASLGYPLYETTLDNGLRVIVNPDHAAPIVAVNLWYDVGSRDEAPGHTGFAHLFEHVMFQGSANVASGEHLAALQAAGGSVNATTWFDRTNYFETLPSGALDLALWLEADRLASLTSALTDQNFATQREVVKEEKRQRYDNPPYGDALERMVRLVFPSEHPYGHTTIGSMADLDASSADDARAFFASHYVPSNAVLTLVGDVTPARGFEAAARYFGGIADHAAPTRAAAPSLPPLADVPRETVPADVPADACYLVWRLPARGTREFDCADIALSVLGAGQASRVHTRLVRDDEIAEAAGAAAMPLIGGTSFGYALARARGGVGAAALEAAMLQELTRLLSDGPSAEEVDRAKVQYEREWLSELASFDSRADLFGAYATLHGNPELVNTRIAEYASIGPDEVLAAARAHLDPASRGVLSFLAKGQPDA